MRVRKGVVMVIYDEQIVVRCSTKLYRAIGAWAKQNNAKPAEVTRRILEEAFGVHDELPLPPGITRVTPTQGAPGKA